MGHLAVTPTVPSEQTIAAATIPPSYVISLKNEATARPSSEHQVLTMQQVYLWLSQNQHLFVNEKGNELFSLTNGRFRVNTSMKLGSQ